MSDVSVPTTPTNPDLREQIPSAIADPGAFVPRAKERGAGGQYESVPQWAARAVGSLVWPLVAEARAEADMHRRTRLRVERVLDEALGAEEKDGTGEGLAADVRLAITRRDEEIERLRVELERHQVLASFFTGDGSQPNYPGTPSFKAWIDTSQELATAQRELDRQRESRIAWALEADRLDHDRNTLVKAVLGLTDQRAALSSLLRDMARRVGQMRRNIEIWRIGRDTDAEAWADEEIVRMRAELSTSASDQTPATDPACDPVGTVRDLGNRTSFPEDNPLAHINRYWIKWAPPHDLDEDRPWVAINHEADLQRMPNDLMAAYPVVPLAELAARLRHAAPSSVQGDTTPKAACVHGQTADLTGLAARENGSDR